MEGSWSATMQGSITKDYSAYKLVTMTVCRTWHLYSEKELNRNSMLSFRRVAEKCKDRTYKKDQSSQKKWKERYMVYIVMKIAQI